MDGNSNVRRIMKRSVKYEGNTLIAEAIGARKRENVPCVYHGRSSSFHVAKVLKNELHKASALYGHMKIEVSGTALITKLVLKTVNTSDKLLCMNQITI